MNRSRKVSLIVGSHGQDGILLTQRLEELNYSVVGLGRNDIDLLNRDQVDKIISSIRPDEIYYLAAYHHSSEGHIEDDGKSFKESLSINTIGLVNILSSLSRILPSGRLFLLLHVLYLTLKIVLFKMKIVLLTQQVHMLFLSMLA